MKYIALSFTPILILSASLMSSCGELRPIWKGEEKLENYEMYYSEPIEFDMDLTNMPSEVDAMLEFVVTYYVGITRNNLPLFIVIQDDQQNIREYTTNIVMKDEGEWLGMPEKNEIDYTLTHIAIPDIRLSPQVYKVKLYANDDNAEKVYGIVKIEARFFERDVEGNP